MHDLKISIITVAYNAGDTIERCIRSVIGQNFSNIEYIVVDGGSSDRTTSIVEGYIELVDKFISEPDLGVYDAMNKGIALASGDIIGMLNADDFFAGPEVLSSVAEAFSDDCVEVVYGDLDYVDSDGRVVRRWRSGRYSKGKLNWGWMPPHPTFYCRRQLFDTFGEYRMDFGTAADYELMLRFIHLNRVNVFYLNSVMVKMITGGLSNRSLANRLMAMRNDLRAMRANKVLLPEIAIFCKPVRKILQFF